MRTTTTRRATTRRGNTRRRTLVGAGAAGTLALALSMTGTLSGFAASITNSVNTGGVGSLAMQETGPDGKGGTATCNSNADGSSATCATINKYGGSMVMGTDASNNSKTTTITIKNTGTMGAASFTLAPGACTLTNTNSNSGDLCSTALVTVKQDGKTIIDGLTPAAIASKSYALTTLAAGASSSFDVTFAIPTTASNTIQGEQVSQPLTWTFNA